MVRATAGRDDYTCDDEADDGDDLDRAEPELRLSVGPRAGKVDGPDHDQHEADPHVVVADTGGTGRVGLAGGGPVGNQHGGGRDLGGERDDVLVPVQPAHGEAQLGGDEAVTERKLTAGHGELRDHLTQGRHDGKQDRRDDDVREEQTTRATVLETVGRAQEETGADSTADGDHLPARCEQAWSALAMDGREM